MKNEVSEKPCFKGASQKASSAPPASILERFGDHFGTTKTSLKPFRTLQKRQPKRHQKNGRKRCQLSPKKKPVLAREREARSISELVFACRKKQEQARASESKHEQARASKNNKNKQQATSKQTNRQANLCYIVYDIL